MASWAPRHKDSLSATTSSLQTAPLWQGGGEIPTTPPKKASPSLRHPTTAGTHELLGNTTEGCLPTQDRLHDVTVRLSDHAERIGLAEACSMTHELICCCVNKLCVV